MPTSSVKRVLKVPSDAQPTAEQTSVTLRSPRRSSEQFAALLDAVKNERLFALFVVAGFTGLRRGELAGLKWRDLDLDTGRLTVRVQRVADGDYGNVVEREVKTEAGQDKPVFLDPGPLTVVKRWKAQQAAERLQRGETCHNTGHIFTQENGEPYHPDRITKIVSRMMRRAGITAAWLHALRHLWAHLLISAGKNLAEVQRLMRHASYTTTSNLYGDVYDAQRAKAATEATALVPWSPGKIA